MKKILLASTALVLSAGVAAADVRVSGDGRMGVTYNSNAADKWAFTQRVRVRFDLSGTTDTGLTFGGFVRAHDAPNAAGGGLGGGQNVFISGAFGRLSMGDVAGGTQTAVGDLHEVGLTGLGFTNENTFFQRNFGGGAIAGNPPFGNGGPNALYTYSMAGFTFAFSMSQPQTAAGSAINGKYSLGVRYEMDGLFVGAGYEYADINGGPSLNHAAVGAGYAFGDFEVRATYGRANNATGNFINANLPVGALPVVKRDQYGLSASASFDAVTGIIYARRDFFNRRNIGLGARYDLGGGASVVGGIVRRTGAGAGSQTVADLGVSMSF